MTDTMDQKKSPLSLFFRILYNRYTAKVLLPLSALLLLLQNTPLAFAHPALAPIPAPLRSPWVLYIGGFGGHYTSDFTYSNRYFQAEIASPHIIQTYSNDTFQQGGLGGGQIGVNYHIHNTTYFLGLLLSGQGNANHSLLTSTILADPDFTSQFRIASIWDVSVLLGSNVTERLQLYSKIGTARNHLQHRLQVTLKTNPNVGTIDIDTASHNIWSWLLGVGISYQITHWLDCFSEYDYYSFPSHTNLKTLNNFIPTITMSHQLSQHIRPTSSAIRLGLNFKFWDTPPPVLPRILPSPWMIYLGAFGGYSGADFQYHARNTIPLSLLQFINQDTFQQGFSGGGQLGALYHYSQPYFAGLNLSILANAEKAVLTQPMLGSATNATFSLSLMHLFDISTVAGADITKHAHLYAKLGIAKSRVKATLSNTQGLFLTPFLSMPYHREDSLWGWILGIGLMRDISPWLNAFAEYDLYGYGRQTPDHIISGRLLNVQVLSAFSAQLRRTLDNTFRIGLNVKFNDHVTPSTDLQAPRHRWKLYLGGFTGYYNADFQYAGDLLHYLGNILFNTIMAHHDTFQRGELYGVHAGAQYHGSMPFFIGLDFSGMGTSRKATITTLNQTGLVLTSLSGPSTFTHQLRIRATTDIAAIFGTDVTSSAQAYIKIGGSRGRLANTDTLTQSLSPATPLSFSHSDSSNLYGWLLGFGATRDWGRWFRGFIEYDQYSYSSKTLTTLQTLFSNLSPGERVLPTERVRLTAWALRLGIDFTIPL